jgi:hypothetical protein
VRLALVVVAVSVTALVAGTLVSAKEGARAHLTTALPLGAAPATTIRVEWTVDVPDGSTGRRPFNAIGMFVRLLSRTGAPSTLGFASPTAHEDGRYAADVSVPRGAWRSWPKSTARLSRDVSSGQGFLRRLADLCRSR